jgi:hypothetical protein
MQTEPGWNQSPLKVAIFQEAIVLIIRWEPILEPAETESASS